MRSGGDAGAQARLQAPPPTEELVAYFTGPVTVGADGYARASFDLPSFNGTVKVMAVAWSKTGVGQASADVLVRDPVVVTASLPRFLAPGDESRLLLEIVHATGPSGRMGLDVSSAGLTLGDVPSGFDLADKAKAVFAVPVTAGAVGHPDHRRRADHAGRQAAEEDPDPAGAGERPRGRADQPAGPGAGQELHLRRQCLCRAGRRARARRRWRSARSRG